MLSQMPMKYLYVWRIMAFFAERKEKSYKSSEKRLKWVTLNN